MDNGWEVLSPEEEIRYQRRQPILWNLIRFVAFPIWAIVIALALVDLL